MLTPEEKATLQEEIVKAVEEQFAVEAEMTRADAIGAVVKAIESLQAEPEMGGLGEAEEAGMPVPEDSDSDGE